ncbi:MULTISPECIES: hypothetical protein [Caproicibacterium]|uniref:Uncharacterized protein n=1 Tax=Caproicibacterium argilliputei TaxID=3030016 RepID=A0AA97DBI1_9FIRM|nr:hypothetical protein [Caproicibacterium argilliputei]WOC32391.1 hypothetical protein PXC00_00560 [Caproicibacterium argilliputei]
MDEQKVNTPNPAEKPEEEPMADAMTFSTSAQKVREEQQAKEAALQRAQQEQQERERAAKAAAAAQADRLAQKQPESRAEKKNRKSSLKKQDKIKRRRRKQEFSEENDPYYGLELKPLEEYQKQYEETLSFKPVQPTEQPSEMTGTFTYLFDGSTEETADDSALQQKLKQLHEERRRRVSQVVKESGVSDVGKEDIFSITTAISLDEIKKAAAAKGVNSERIRTGAAPKAADTPQAPVREPQPPRSVPQKEAVPHPMQEPAERPAPLRAVQEPLTPEHSVQTGAPVTYRPVGTPVHILALQDLTTPLFNESREYPRLGRREAPMPSGSAVPVAPPDEAENITRLPAAEAVQPVKPKADSSVPPQEAEPKREKAPVVPFTQAHPAAKEPEQPVQVPDRFANEDETQPAPRPAAEVPLPGSAPVPPAQEQPTYRKYEAAARAMVQEIDPNAPAETPQQPKRKILRRAAREQTEQMEQQARASQPDPSDLDDLEALNIPLPIQEAKPASTDEVEDYNSREDAASIFHQLGGDMRELMLRLTVTGICAVLELIFGIFGEFGLFGMPPLNITAYLICNLIFLSCSVGFCGVTILNGLKALFKLRANADTGVAVASIAGVMQAVAALFMQSQILHGQLHLYSVIVCGALFFNTLGKLTLVRRVNKNFHYITSPDKTYSVEKFDDHNTALQMAEGVTLDAPEIAYQRETDFLKNFLRLSYSDDPSDRSSQFLAPVLFCASLVLFLVMLLFVQPHNVNSALTAFAAATCVSVPIMNMLSVNLPLSRISRVAAQCGGMVIGFPAVQYYADTNAVMVDAKDLFPRGSVILNGIKTFGSAQMDDVIVDAAALMHKAGGPLSSLFEQIIQSRMDSLPKVENIQYEDGMGVSGWVGGRRVFIGNRRLMEHHSITPPSEALEAKYIRGGKQLAYLSVGGELVAMFIVTYRADRHRTMELQRMEDNGISLIVRSNDPNVTAPFTATLFGLDVHTVRVLPERLGQVYESLVKEPTEESHALLATRGKPSTMMRLITACVRQRANISMAVALQNVGAVLGFVLVAFLCCQQGMQQVSTLSLVIYEAFWTLAVWLVPKLRKP